MANMNVSVNIDAATQQQWFSRNTAMSSLTNGGFSIVLVGNTNAPHSHCGDQGGVPFTTVEKTPVVAEKPYIIKSAEGYSLMVPRLEKDKMGPSYDNADEIPFSKVYVAKENDTAATINSMINDK